ncbi:MAG: ABC transporter permease [Cytophagales bacterium]|nr:ABC transporter permease [Rhizobacter sp.]
MKLRYLARRLGYLLFIMLAVTALTSALGSLLPGDVAAAMLGNEATPENVAALRTKLGLDQPLWQQYWRWITGVFSGEFGESHRTGESVMQAIKDRLPVTLEVVLAAQVIALAIGVSLGVLSAAKRDTWVDRVITGGTFAMISLPGYLVAIGLIYVFAVWLHVLPAGGYVPFGDDPAGHIRCLILPVFSLAIVEWPVFARTLRSDMITTLREDFILMARAKGLSSRRILFLHALKPSSLALITFVGLTLGRLVGGALVLEVIFSLPGLGQMIVDSILTRDFITLQGGVVFVTLGFLLVNFVVDMLYGVLDPRIRHAGA